MIELNETEAAIAIAVIDELSDYYNEEAWQSYYEQYYEEDKWV